MSRLYSSLAASVNRRAALREDGEERVEQRSASSGKDAAGRGKCDGAEWRATGVGEERAGLAENKRRSEEVLWRQPAAQIHVGVVGALGNIADIEHAGAAAAHGGGGAQQTRQTLLVGRSGALLAAVGRWVRRW